ncbi:hypothetical protein HKD37_15G043888 [Glycine soja]
MVGSSAWVGRRCHCVAAYWLTFKVLLSSVNDAMERSSSSYTSKARSRVLCLCNIEAPLVTSWTEDNPGRRFYGCGLYKVTSRKWCNYFEWHDPVANSRQKKIMVALMKKVDELELREKDLQSRIRDMKRKEIFLGILLVVCWEESDVDELV